MKIVITKYIDKIKLAYALRKHFWNNTRSMKTVLDIVNNLPYIEDCWGEEYFSFLDGIAEFHFEKSEKEIDEELNNKILCAKYDEARIWYDSLSKEDQEKVDLLTSCPVAC